MSPGPEVEALVLPAELTIYAVGALHPQWRAWAEQFTQAADDGAPAEVLASAVDQVDAAGVQLLLSLQRSLAARGHRCTLRQPSRALETGCAALGLAGWLAEHAEPAEVAGVAA